LCGKSLLNIERGRRRELFSTPYWESWAHLTISELFSGKQPNILLVDPSAFKKAAKEIEGGSQENFQF